MNRISLFLVSLVQQFLITCLQGFDQAIYTISFDRTRKTRAVIIYQTDFIDFDIKHLPAIVTEAQVVIDRDRKST